eukprot:5917156-Prymnesium_polylepis.1
MVRCGWSVGAGRARRGGRERFGDARYGLDRLGHRLVLLRHRRHPPSAPSGSFTCRPGAL